MPTPPAGYAEIVVHLNTPMGANKAAWTFAIKKNAGWSMANFATWLAGIGAGQYRINLYNLYGIASWDLVDSSGTVNTVVNLAGGTASSNMATPGLAQIIRKNTGLPGHSERGRMYWPGCISENDIDNAGNIAAATITARQTCATALLTALTTGNAPMVLLHRSGATPTPVTSLTPLTIVGSQRRRQR